ncbi:hypothetical protein ABZY36_35550 [Streptomyces sp. NPDC006627]|uniref:hypothetical protein n=1 Tax=Streptomyces sp. NPDC006627 TaxID=3154679 RepID=UPI00339F6ACB
MERIYINHRDGERRIHVEIDESEVHALAAGDDAATSRLRAICAEAGRRWPVAGDGRG